MKRVVCAVCSCVLLLLFSVGSYAAENYYTPNHVFVSQLPSTNPPTIPISNRSFGNSTTNITLDSAFQYGFVIGAKYDIVDLDRNAYYTVSFAVTTAASVTIPDTSKPDLYSCYTDASGYILNWSAKYFLSSNSTVSRVDGITIIKFSDVTGEELATYSTLVAHFDINDFTGTLVHFLDATIELSSVYSDELFAGRVMDKLDQMIEQDQEQHEETKGLLQKIIDGITSIPQKIKESFKALIDEVVGSVTDSISSAMDSFLAELEDKLGILYQAPDYFIRIIEAIMTTESSNEMTFPSMVIPVAEEEYTLNEPTPFQIFPDWIPDAVYTFLNMAMSIIVIISVINYADKKWEEITTNG